MNQDFVLYLLGTGWLGAKLLTVVIEVAGNSLYDIRQIREQKKLAKYPRAKTSPRPLISVVVQAHNAQETVEQCLKSIINTRYRKLEIVVIDNASNDNTGKVIKDFMAKHPKQRIRLVSRRKYTVQDTPHPGGALKGTFVVRLGARDMLDKSTLRSTADHFALHDETRVLLPGIRVGEHKSLLGLLQQFVSHRLATKHRLGISSNSHGQPVISRNKPLKKAQGTYYASDLVVISEPSRKILPFIRSQVRDGVSELQAGSMSQLGYFGRRARAVVGMVLFLEPIAVGYFLYLALKFQRVEPLAIAWVLGVFALIFYVWSDGQATFWRKIKLTALAPSMYILMYLLSFTRLVVALNYLLVVIQQELGKEWQTGLYIQV